MLLRPPTTEPVSALRALAIVACVGCGTSGSDDEAGAATDTQAADDDGDGDGNEGPLDDDDDDGEADGLDGDSDPSSGGGDDAPGDDDDTGPGGPVIVTCDDTPPVTTAPPPQWINVTGSLAGMASECGNLTMVSAKPCSSAVIAGVALTGLHATNDGGQSWSPLGSGAGSAVITNRPASIVYDPENPDVFWESGIYNGGGVYRTDDGGLTFTQLGDFGHNDLVTVDFSDPARQTLLAGSHEQKQRLMLSTDGGANWNDIGPNLPADSHFSSAPLVLDGSTFLVGACGWGDGTCGVFRSIDTGVSWSMVSDLPAVGQPRWASDGNIYWSMIYNSGVARSSDAGQSWMQTPGGGGLVSGYPVELPDGRLLMAGGDHVMVSADAGTTWNPIGEPLPYGPAGVTFSAQTKTLFIWRNDCGNSVLPDAIMSAGFDDTL